MLSPTFLTLRAFLVPVKLSFCVGSHKTLFMANRFGAGKLFAIFSKTRFTLVTECMDVRKLKPHIGRPMMMLSLFLVPIHQLSQRTYLSKYSESISKRSPRPRTLLQRVPIISTFSSVDSFVPIAESL